MGRPLRRLTLPILQLLRRMPQKRLMFILAIVVGVLVAIAGHLLKEAIHLVQNIANSFSNAENENWVYLVFPTIGIALTVLFVRYYVRDDISHGVTRIFYAISRRKSRIKSHNTYTSVISSATTIGFGGSVGAEAPIVLTGAAIGSNLGQFLRLRYNLLTLLVGCGAAAAIAAVYKAPIAGFAFVLEVLMLELTFTSVVPLLIASVTAATATYLMVGIEPFFGNYTPVFHLDNIVFYGVLGVLGGVLSYFFSNTTMWLEGYFKKYKKVWLKVLCGGLVLGLLIFIFPPLYGEGYTSITGLLEGDTTTIFNHSLFFGISDNMLTLVLYVLGILFFKVIAMTVTNASGGVGGTFAPSLFFGAMMGYLFAVVCNYCFDAGLPEGSFTLVGMAAIMSGVMKAPITSMFLVAELTGGFQLFLPLMLASAVSFALSYYFEPYSIYTKRLALRGELLTHNKDENALQFIALDRLVEHDFATVRSDGTLHDLIDAVAASSRNIFAVIDGNRVLRGVIYLDDIREDMFKSELWDNTPLRSYMSHSTEIIRQGDSARTIVDRFEQSGLWNMPVVDSEGRYDGFVSKSRVLSAYREQLQRLSED
ncbi:MAG: chloride channel protein [Rikenellaceae bacterium]